MQAEYSFRIKPIRRPGPERRHTSETKLTPSVCQGLLIIIVLLGLRALSLLT